MLNFRYISKNKRDLAPELREKYERILKTQKYMNYGFFLTSFAFGYFLRKKMNLMFNLLPLYASSGYLVYRFKRDVYFDLINDLQYEKNSKRNLLSFYLFYQDI